MTALPSTARMLAAVLARDADFDGVFFLGVRTTGIFCRPICPARSPRPENVEFFPTATEAQRAGFRACKRCQPLAQPGAPAPWLEALVSELERAPLQAISDADLSARGIAPQTARRAFRTRFGMTFHAYQRALRLGIAADKLGAGAGLDGVGMDVGFESTSGFRDAFQRIFGVPPGRARGTQCVVGSLLSSPLGSLVAAATPRGLCLLEFADRNTLASAARTLQRRTQGTVVPGRNTHIEQLAAQLDEYFRGMRAGFDVALDVRATEFQRLVWDELLRIPCGETRSYEDVALAIGRPRAQRAVGRANGSNPVTILVPCHRVVQKNGQLRGYAGGLWRKRWLLDHEAQLAGQTPLSGGGSTALPSTPVAQPAE